MRKLHKIWTLLSIISLPISILVKWWMKLCSKMSLDENPNYKDGYEYWMWQLNGRFSYENRLLCGAFWSETVCMYIVTKVCLLAVTSLHKKLLRIYLLFHQNFIACKVDISVHRNSIYLINLAEMVHFNNNENTCIKFTDFEWKDD